MSKEIEILKEFVEEFSPLHTGQTQNLTYDELFTIVTTIVNTHNGRELKIMCNLETLPNGAVIVDKKPGKDSFYSVVLCKKGAEFITWVMNSETKATFSGHYFRKITNAVKDFDKREY